MITEQKYGEHLPLSQVDVLARKDASICEVMD